ncbi:hypothetical protein LTR78_008534 [Recurvomyces mirabilis]|uniref:Stress-response A/B barrel domain-containing protein n=1 Tax=Recurvomyces mirabilis TaxID=574656 RepID=A0AAE0WGY3_9PEZI|nr:hypothetical protein LTR78_008534 [Recurvomyces mirabilis]KAK5156285.1 hypothetical protein LTS14_005173 [Recurvomyces mirabilis]
MPVYHIVLFKLKQGVKPEQIAQMSTLAKGMVGQIPGLRKLDFGGPLPVTAGRGKGYDMGIVAILDKPDDVTVYAQHPAHQE